MKSGIYTCLLMVCGLLVTNPASARTPAAHTAAAQPALPSDAIDKVADDGVITLKSGGEAVLAGVSYPQLIRAADWLRAHAGQPITVRALGNDRYGRARILPKMGAQTLQQMMVKDGAALVFDRDNVPGMASWLKDEAAARQKKTGIWADVDLMLTPDHMDNFRGQFHLVEGVVRHIYEARDATYLNFGDDWKKDFSVSVPKGARRNFGDALENIEGKKVRVRGYIYEDHGPMILISRPEQLEILSHDKK